VLVVLGTHTLNSKIYIYMSTFSSSHHAGVYNQKISARRNRTSWDAKKNFVMIDRR